jgi:hypothetical protein
MSLNLVNIAVQFRRPRAGGDPVHHVLRRDAFAYWIPACAGMTIFGRASC